MSAMTAELKSTSDGQTMVLTLSNPAARNALEPHIYAAGVEALNAAETNPDVRSIVIVGEGAWFCAGGNVTALQENRQRPAQEQAQRVEALHDWIETIRTCPKPVLAAVEGAAAGAGFSLALACDFVIAARDAQFVTSYSSLGLSPDGGATWHLGRNVPRQLASMWLMLADGVSAERLHGLGLVSLVCDPGDALGRALALAQRLNDRAPNALTSIKDLLNEAADATLPEQLDNERDHFVRNLFQPAAGTAIAQFLSRKPRV